MQPGNLKATGKPVHTCDWHQSSLLHVAMYAQELVRRGAPGLWWALVLAFMSAGPALMGFVVLLHNGWLAICLRCFCHLLEGHDGAGLTEVGCWLLWVGAQGDRGWV